MKVYQLNFEGDLTYLYQLSETPIIQKLREELKGEAMVNNNHLKSNFALNPTNLEKSNIAKHSIVNNITKKIIEDIDFSDKTFINRLDSEDKVKESEEFLPLVNSIKDSGLLNPIYLLEKGHNKYLIVSGWRRSLALKTILEETPNKIWQKQAVIFREGTPVDLLEKVSIDENTKRKDLSILELSYKFNKLSEDDKIPLDDILKIFGIAKSQFYAIRKAIDFNPVIKEILEEIGPIKADYLDKILFELIKNNKDKKYYTEEENLVLSYKNKTRDELKEILKNLKESNKEENKKIDKLKIFDFKRTPKKTTITIKQKLSDEEYEKIQEFITNITEK